MLGEVKLIRLLLTLTLGAVLCAAAPRVVVGAVPGDSRGRLAAQISAPLCRTLDCVSFGLVAPHRLLSWSRMHSAHVGGVFLVQLTRTARGRALVIDLSTGPGEILHAWTLVLRGTKLSTIAVAQMVEEARELLDPTGGRAPPVTPEPPPTVAKVPPPPRAQTLDLTPTGPPDSAAIPPTVVIEPARGRPPSALPFAAVDLGLDALHRNFSVSGQAAAPQQVRAYNAGLLIAPHFHAELYPFLRRAPSSLDGFGLSADYAFATWYSTSGDCASAANGAPCAEENRSSHPTSYQRFDFAVTWRFAVSEGWTLVPSLGLRLGGFSVGADAAGRSFVNFPNTSDNGVELGLKAAFQWTDRLAFLGELALVPRISGGELLGPRFFPEGHGYALELGGGVSLKLLHNVDARLLGSFLHEGYTFPSRLKALYPATGASDDYVSLKASLRYSF